MPDAQPLTWLHIGDLHITRETGRNFLELKRIVALMERLPAGSVDFAVLPGDNADDGTPEQFILVRDAVALLSMPLHILPGDRDFKPRTLDAFHDVLGAARLPKAVVVRRHRCLFLDMVSAGTGGSDFRLGEDQLSWVEHELELAERAGQDIVIFMHTYLVDLRENAAPPGAPPGAPLGTLLARPHVVCMDMGHTHYNEIGNDGATIFMTTCSTGQVEEGPPGFSISAVDGGCVSWRFKPLDTAWPFVLITHPADRRLATEASLSSGGRATIRAKVLGDAPIDRVEMRVDDGDGWTPMRPMPCATALCEAPVPAHAIRVAVRACDANGRTDQDQLEPAAAAWTPARRHADGSDANRIGAWPERGILGTQLGPNRNGRKW